MKVYDPVCGMTIEEKEAVATSLFKGKVYRFCSEACKSDFDKKPEVFLKSGGTVGVTSNARVTGTEYTCPMHPEVRQVGPGSCPKCGMALEPATPVLAVSKKEWICPMHPEIVRDEPGTCPICGMTLEPRTVTLEAEENLELADMTRRFKVGLIFTIPLVLLAMLHMIPGLSSQHLLSWRVGAWIELVLATPVVLWCGWPFFIRFWQSLTNKSPNMFTLIGLGVGVAYVQCRCCAGS